MRARLALAVIAVLLSGCPMPSEETGVPPALRVIGHRGARGLAPENTLAALAAARDVGLGEVEVDVRMSRDGALVLFHDARLDRKTQLEGAVADHDLAALRKAEIGSWFDRNHPRIPRRYSGTPLTTLDEALSAFGGRFLWHLEIKGDEAELPGALLEAVARAGLEDRVIVSSFHTPQLLRVRALAPSVPLCQLVGWSRGRTAEEIHEQSRLTPEEGIARAAEHGFAMLGIAAEDLTEARVREARARGIAVRAFRLHDETDVDRMLALGVDGITVARPDRVLAALAARGL